MSAYLMDVNPFDQPGVEEYKNILTNKLDLFKQTLINKRNKQKENIDENEEDNYDESEDDEDESEE